MLTFEEFFFKKKIDTAHFKIAEPVLFAEFSSHYPLMGEKSFDHTKKYWFNNLRRTYPLQQEIKPHAVQAEAISPMAVQAVAVAAAQNVAIDIERPKFKEDHLPELVEANVPEQDISLAKEENLITETESSVEVPATKPAFKPRFNPKNIPKTAENSMPEAEVQTPDASIEQPKPAFKPRFNMQNIKKEPVKTVVENEVVIPVQETSDQPKPKTETTKPAYKPRFQMKNVPKPPTE